MTGEKDLVQQLIDRITALEAKVQALELMISQGYRTLGREQVDYARVMGG